MDYSPKKKTKNALMWLISRILCTTKIYFYLFKKNKVKLIKFIK